MAIYYCLCKAIAFPWLQGMVGLLMRFAVDISALAGFCQSWQAEKFYLKGCSLLNLQDTKLWLTLFFGECINNKSRSLKITIKILLKFKSKKNGGFPRAWRGLHEQRQRPSSRASDSCQYSKCLRRGTGLGEKRARLSRAAMCFTKLCHRVFCTTPLCRICDISPIFFHQPLYMINKTMHWKHWNLSSMSLWKGPR